MRPCLISVDLQRAFLDDRRLEPSPGQLLAGARAWQERFRSEDWALVHVRTSVSPPERPALPHWDSERIGRFTSGAEGWQFAPGVGPLNDEPIVEKSHYTAFQSGHLEELLREVDVDEIVLVGVHVHGCIRSTALDASALGFKVSVAADATASNDAPHAAATRRWMSERAFRFTDLASWETRTDSPPQPGAPTTASSSHAARPASEWAALPWERRTAALEPLAARLREASTALAEAMAGEIHKPLRDGLEEVEFGARLAEHALARGAPPEERTADGRARRLPHGTVLLITPWNNPVGIFVGKIVPALAHGNIAIWKPSPHCPQVSSALEDVLSSIDLPPGVIERVDGGPGEVAALIAGGSVDAVSVTGSLATGRALQDACAAQLIPLQAELGGNNAAIVAAGADIDAVADELVAGAFSFAGQRCTATRRAIAVGEAYETLVDALKRRVEVLRPGDPHHIETILGPVRALASADRIEALLDRARVQGADVWRPSWANDGSFAENRSRLPFVAPAVIEDAAPDSEIEQDESFGPVLVVSSAASIADAIDRSNGVTQGLVASIHSPVAEDVDQFTAAAAAGVLKLNRSAAGAAPSLPFGGIGASGIGPPEHGPGDADFYSRWQAVS